MALGLLHAVKGGDAGAHADSGVDDRKGRKGAEGVAADVAGGVDLEFFEDGVGRPVGTSGAEDRRAGRDLGSRFDAQILTEDALADHVGAVFALDGEEFLADAVDSPGADLLLDHGLKFFKDIKDIDLLREVLDQLLRQGIAHAELEDGGIGTYFLDILIRDAAGNEADFFAVDGHIAHLDLIERLAAGPLFHVLHTLLDNEVALFGHAGHHDALGGVSLVLLVRRLYAVTEFDFTLGMSETGRRADDDRRVELLADLIGVFHKVLGFLGIRGLQAGHDGCAADAPGILLVLGAVQAGVIGDDKDKAAVRTDIGHGIKRISRHVQADHLHAGQGTNAGKGSADRDFRGNLLIRCPLGIHSGVFYEFLTDLRAGSPGIGRGDLHAGFPCAARDRGVTQHHLFFTHMKPLFCSVYVSVYVLKPVGYTLHVFNEYINLPNISIF